MEFLYCVAALSFLQAVISSRELKLKNPDYLIVVPRVLRGGTTVNIGINLFGQKPCNVEVELYSAGGNSYGKTKGKFNPNEAGELELMVPENSAVEKIGATVCGTRTSRKRINYQPRTEKIFIQTDKPIYKPGQKILMRIIYLNSELKPAGKKISSIVIEEPHGFKIMQWNDVKLRDGIASLELQLSKEPVIGMWKIKADHGKTVAEKKVEVKKYVVPKFEVEIKPPAYLARDQNEIEATICARYTYGKPVKGLLVVRLCLDGRSSYRPCHEETKNITGCEEIVTKLFDSKTLSSYWYDKYSLKIQASFTEESTGTKVKKVYSSSAMVRHSKTLSFVDTSKKFKPGLPFTFKVSVSYLDGKPVTEGQVKISIRRSRFYYHGSRSLFTRIYYVKNGLITDVVENMPHDTNSLRLTAKYSFRGDSFGSTTHTSKAWFSPSLSYLQLTNTRKTMAEIGRNASVRVFYTVRNDTDNNIDFNFKIFCKGNLIQSNVQARRNIFRTKRWSPRTLEQLTPEITKASRKKIPTLPKNDEVPPFKHIPKPIVKEFLYSFPVTLEMVPACRILAYYVRSDKETVGDSIVFDVEDKLKNEVSIDFLDRETRPGAKTKLVLAAKPGSRVAISALDKSILLLRGANNIKKTEVVNILSQLDVGETEAREYEENRCSRYGLRSGARDADVSQAFNAAGVIFLTSLKIFTLPCRKQRLTFDEATDRARLLPLPRRVRYWRPFHSFGGPRSGGPSNRGYHGRRGTWVTVLVTPQKYQAPSPRPSKARKKLPRKPPKTVKVRKNFPEAWLWTDFKLNNSSGIQTLEVQVPDSITTWVANGFAMSSVYGMGVADDTVIKAYQPFFVQMKLPYSVIRGEEIPVTVTVFNYLASCVPIKLELDRQSSDYKVTSFHISKFCVCDDEAKSIKFKIIPHKLGRIPLTVKAVTSQAKLCPRATIYAADAVTRKLLVEPEGIREEYTRGTFLCVDGGHNSETFYLNLPKAIIPGSVLPRISVIGDIMGPALSNLDGLLEMPYGCGEQNMAKFAPNIYIMDYLTNTNQVTVKIKDDALRYMNSGYQRELTYKRKSGAYSIFGNRDKRGSMMLTAFVVRSFARAQKYIFVDGNEMEHSIKWFKKKQMASGCFPNYGKVFYSSLQGGVNSELTITAYVTIALLEAGLKPKSTMVSKALACISGKLDFHFLDSYTTSLVTYTLVLAQHTKAGEMMMRLKNKAIRSKAGQLYWSDSSKGQSAPADVFYRYVPQPAADVEMTGYALMAYLKHKEYLKDVIMIIKWLSKQRNYYGGFRSTQDTCVALQALSEAAKKLYGKEQNLSVSVNIKKHQFSHEFKVMDKNKMILQRMEISSQLLPSELEIVGKGSGCALVQASVAYNIPAPKEVPAFKVDVGVRRRRALADEERTTCYPLELDISVEWLKKGVSNMAIVDIKLVSGFSVNEESLRKKVMGSGNGDAQEKIARTRRKFTRVREEGITIPGNDAVQEKTVNLKRYEIEGQHVILYFDEIKTMNFTLDITQSTLVKKMKPAVIKVYDYYDPESQAKVMYSITERDCYGEKIKKECPTCISVNDLEDLFDKNINCSSYLIRAKSTDGLIKVKKAYIKSDRTQNKVKLPFEIPEFCPCEEIYDGMASLVFGYTNYFRNNGRKTSLVLNRGTTIAKWVGKKMRRVFRKKMKRIYLTCWRFQG